MNKAAIRTLVAQPRKIFGKKINRYRREGFIPGVVYGGHRKETAPVLVSENDFMKVFSGAGESSLITLRLGDADRRTVLVHDVARHPVTNKFLHIDFYEVRMDEKLKTKIPLVFIGESPAVKNEGGVLVKALQEIAVECLPKDLPHEIAVDVSGLASFGNFIRLRDIVLPPGVELRGDKDDVVALVEEPRVEEATAAAAAEEEQAAISQIKTEAEEKRGKKETEKKEEAAA